MTIRAFTILSRSARLLSQYIRSLDISQSSTSLFALNTPQESLQTIFDTVTNLPSTNLGCISSQINANFPFSFAFLNIPQSVDHRIWRSTIPGTEKAQVGRWYSREQMSREPQETDIGSPPSWSERMASRVWKGKLPPPLQELVDTQKGVSSLLYLTDDASEGLADALTHHFPHAPKLGLTAASTPFITGRPFTIFESGTFHSSGAIGIAFHVEEKQTCTVAINRLKTVGTPMRVTSSASNMIYTLDTSPAVDVLAKVVPGPGPDSHNPVPKTAFLGIFDVQGKLCRTFSISAGSPSRGAILLNGEWAPGEGTTVQFLIYQDEAAPYLSTLLSSASMPEAHFLCLSQDDTIPMNKTLPRVEVEDFLVTENKFIASSEGGFSLDDGLSLQSIWRCTTPHVVGSISLPR